MGTARRTPSGDLLFKLRVVYLPFIIMALSFIGLYSLLHWGLFIRTGSTAVKEEVLHFWLPMILPWIPLWIWLRPRIKTLRLQSKKGDPVFAYLLVAAFAMAVPTIVAQGYLATATGELTALDNVHKLKRTKPTKYYTVKNYFIDKEHAAADVAVRVSGKYNSDLSFALSVACPLYHNKDVMKLSDLRAYDTAVYKPTVMLNGEVLDSAQVAALVLDPAASIHMLGLRASRSVYGREAWNGAIFIDQPRVFTDEFVPPSEIFKFSPKAWLCVTYRKTISNRLSDEEKNRAYRQFLEESAENFRVRKLEGFTYLDRIGHSDEREGYASAIKKSSYYDNSNPVILEPVYAPYSERNGSKPGWVFGSFGIGAGVWLLMVLFPRVQTRNLARVRRQQRTGKEMRDLLNLAVPREGYWVTPVILDLNLLVFLAMVMAGTGFVSFSAEDLVLWGGNFRPYTVTGEWWRLLTSMFLHGGVLHLVMNMMGLVFVSVFLEPLLGSLRLALIYLLTGLVGSVASLLWYEGIVSVGASGAVFGLYGVFLALLLTKVFPPAMKKAFLVSTVVFVGYNLLLGLGGGIDNAAHIGGLVSGLVTGFCLYPFLKQKEETVTEANFEFEKTGQAPAVTNRETSDA